MSTGSANDGQHPKPPNRPQAPPRESFQGPPSSASHRTMTGSRELCAAVSDAARAYPVRRFAVLLELID
ncbi:hypothetical protein CCMA1212_005673 [Trichoderma ghanense]|uniref:Uncharacterized protein n=1 Tax=Trichoderma ghanense TaxID=65468 RepID=A0ABY2H1M9_9HYPO